MAFPETYPFEIFDLPEGLPQSQVMCLAQDREGFLWVGTRGGLSRFNGVRFVNYFAQDGLPSSQIEDLGVDRQGVLWIATRTGLAFWRDHRLGSVTDPLVSNVFCRSLAEDKSGNLWIGTDHGLILKKGDRFVPVLDEGRQNLGLIYGLAADDQGLLIVSSAGLFQVQDLKLAEKIQGPDIPAGTLRAVYRTADGIWVGSMGQGAFLFSGGRWAPVPIGGRTVTRMYADSSGAFYIASMEGGIDRRLAGQAGFDTITASKGLRSRMVRCVIEDAQKNLWVGTELGGLARLRNAAVRNYFTADGLPAACVLGIRLSDRPDELWMSTVRGLARCRVDDNFKVLETFTSRDGLADEFVWDTILSPQGELWVMTNTAFHIRAPGRRRFEPLSKDLAIPRQEISGMCLDGQGRIWLAGTDPESPLAVRDETGRWRSWKQSDEGKSIFHCREVTPRREGGVWVGAEGRVLMNDGFKLREIPDGLPVPAGTHIISMLEDKQGRLWVGTEGDLFVHDIQSGWRPFKNESGFNFSQVYFIGEDRQGTIWVGVANGVLRIKSSGKVEPFAFEEGLAGLETNQYGFLAHPDGTIWIGTITGVSRINLDRLTTPPAAAPLVVEAADLANRSVPFPKSLELPWKDRTISFRVSVLSFNRRQGDFFRARMEGMETDWQITRRSNGIRYTNIPPGRYQLVLQAELEPGKWGEPTAIPIHIQTPFWLTWGFRLAAVALVAAVAFGLFLGRTRLLRQRAQVLERIVAERTDKLVEANEELERLATHDPLTGLWNRRAILNRLEEVCRQPASAKGPQAFGLIIVDLDDFKQVNESLGHLAGDTVLVSVARQIEEQTRQGDSVGRYGGDEFLVILPGADREALESVVQRIADKSYKTRVEGQLTSVTASCGAVAVSGVIAPKAMAVLTQADELLFQSKKSGKHSYLIAALAGRSASRYS